MRLILSQCSSELVLECRKELAHYSFHVIVCQSLVKILEHEAESILLLALCDLVASVHVKQTNLLEKLLADAERALAKVCIAYRLIEKESEVTSYLRELRKFLVLDLVSLHKLKEGRPVDLGSEYRLFDTELFESCR